MFVAHSLQTLGNQVTHLLPSALSQTSSTFIDLVPHIRAIGKESLRKQLQAQRDLMFETLAQAKGITKRERWKLNMSLVLELISLNLCI